MLTRGGFDIIKVLKNYSAKSERRGSYAFDSTDTSLRFCLLQKSSCTPPVFSSPKYSAHVNIILPLCQ